MQPPFEYLGPYRIGEPLGRGGMGTVYHGTHAQSGQQVAVKLIGSTVADDSRFRRRFADEIETLKRLKHPHIVSLIGYGEQAGQLFYSMELVDGESLQQRLKREKRIAWPAVIDMAISVCAALKHAHDFGVIHRDLKPANLLVSPQGTVKLVDFGIAKLFGTSDQTAAGSVLGTADYMAPEQVGGGPISPRTDLYALGNVLYACLAGRPPYAGRSFTEVIQSLQRESVPRLDLYAPGLPVEIVELVHDLLAKRPEDRPPTALAVSNRLKAIRAGLSRMQDTAGPAAEPSTVVPADSIVNRPTTAAELDEYTLGQLDETASHPAGPVPAAGRGQLNVAAADGATVAVGSPAGREPETRGEPAAVEPSPVAESTHYRVVDDRERARGYLAAPPIDAAEPSSWGQRLSVVGMLAVLAGGGFLFWRAGRQPTADELYAEIQQAQTADNRVVYRDHAERFLKLYPDDPRGDGLDIFADDRSILQVVRRLQATAQRQGGIDQLPADEQAFLAAVADRQTNPHATRQRLQQWLDVFAPREEPAEESPPSDAAAGSHSRLQMTKTVQRELDRLREVASPAGDRRLAELRQRIEWSERLEPAEQRKLLEGIVTLFEDKSWARPVVSELRQRLRDSP